MCLKYWIEVKCVLMFVNKMHDYVTFEIVLCALCKLNARYNDIFTCEKYMLLVQYWQKVIVK